MSDSPIFVVGIGRCGTSTTARLLHTRLGVRMGELFRPGDSTNPQGYYEDLEFKRLNEVFLQQGWRFIATWTSQVREIVERRQVSDRTWGLKDPRLCYLLPYYLALCPRVTVIRCVRAEDAVVRSLHLTYGWDLNSSRTEYMNRETALDLALGEREYVTLNFTERREDEDILEQLTTLLDLAKEM